uniref:Uncharacterized protein n=1 Tax=Avena sativa TaxID=4498 RepID=A0ACD5YD87_AVESA
MENCSKVTLPLSSQRAQNSSLLRGSIPLHALDLNCPPLSVSLLPQCLISSRPVPHHARKSSTRMPRRLLQESVDRLTGMAAPSLATAKAGGVHTDTLLILAAVLCFLLCVVGLSLVARCCRLCNPSAFSVEAMPAKAPCKGIKKKALQSMPTQSWAAPEKKEEGDRAECAICLAEFASGDEVRVLPQCGHGFHAACVDVWLMCSSTCPSCRRALVVVSPTVEPAATCSSCVATAADAAAAQASTIGHCRSLAQ